MKGKATRPIADAAGDRRSEAKAVIETHTGHKPDEPELETVEDEIRRRHGDVQS
ncbi:MAG: hypothetical protein QOH28_2738 [Actinomycetota bacterium]|jgi:hypothetical protein|nr:hypothetical protein [Actinomycetota bacterium]